MPLEGCSTGTKSFSPLRSADLFYQPSLVDVGRLVATKEYTPRLSRLSLLARRSLSWPSAAFLFPTLLVACTRSIPSPPRPTLQLSRTSSVVRVESTLSRPQLRFAQGAIRDCRRRASGTLAKPMSSLGGCRSRLSRIPVTHFRTLCKTTTRPRFWKLATTTTDRVGFRNFSNSIAKMTDSKTKWTAPLVRKQFLEYFEKRGHTIGM